MPLPVADAGTPVTEKSTSDATRIQASSTTMILTVLSVDDIVMFVGKGTFLLRLVLRLGALGPITHISGCVSTI